MNGKIDFIGIGAQKAGTSWIYENLRILKEFDLPPVKEFHYFDKSPSYPTFSKLTKVNLHERLMDPEYLANASKRINYFVKKKNLKKVKFFSKWYFSEYNDEWYKSIFDDMTGFTGEITPSYSILDIEDIKRMKDLAPQAKIILIVRNPIHRAWSHYRYFLSMKFNTITTKDLEFNKISKF